MINKYFKHWNIDAPVFTNRTHSFIELKFQEKAISKAEILIQSSTPSIAITGESGLGKSSILSHLYAKLPISHYTCLSFQPTSSSQNENDLLKKILKHLRTNLEVNLEKSKLINILTEEMSKLKSSSQSLVIFLDLDRFENELPKVFDEALSINDVSQKMNLPLTFVFSINSQTAELEKSKIENISSVVSLEYPTTEDIDTYTKEMLIASSLREDLFSDKNLNLIYSKSEGNLNKYNLLCEDVLIEAAFAESTNIDSQLIFDMFISTKSKKPDFSSSIENLTQNIKGIENKNSEEEPNLNSISANTIRNDYSPIEIEESQNKNNTQEETLPLSILDPNADKREIIHEELDENGKFVPKPEQISSTNSEESNDNTTNLKVEDSINNSPLVLNDPIVEVKTPHADNSSSESNTSIESSQTPILSIEGPIKESKVLSKSRIEKKKQSIKKDKNRKQLLKEKAKEKVAVHSTPFTSLLKDA